MTELKKIDSEEFLAANRDYINRIEKDGVQVIYDSTLDTLFVEFGGPKRAITEHLLDNILLRIDPITLEVVGCEVLDFLEDFVPGNRLVASMVEDAGLKRDQDSSFTLMEPQARALGEFIMSGVPTLV